MRVSVVAFDTLKFARSLRDKAKLSPEQAEGFADAIAEAMQGDLATKADLQGVKSEIRETRSDLHSTDQAIEAKLRELELRLTAEIQASKAEIVKWAVGSAGLQTIAILGTVFALMRVLKP
jgi:hypothetical protein